MARRASRVLGRSSSLASLVTLVACAGTPGSSRLEDRARRDVPVTICRRALGQGDMLPGGGPKPVAYDQLIVPSVRAFDTALESTSSDCVGEPLQPALGGATGGGLLKFSEGDLSLSKSSDDLQIAWLRLGAAEGPTGSPLALVRARPSEIDLYAMGRYKAPKGHARFSGSRIGTTLVVAAFDDGCSDVKVDRECESGLTFFVNAGGQLRPVATTPVERIQYGVMTGVGRVQYRLTTDAPVYDATSVHVKERLTVRDSGDDEVRRSEGERVFTLKKSELAASGESIWTQVAESIKTGAKPGAAPSAPAPSPPPAR